MRNIFKQKISARIEENNYRQLFRNKNDLVDFSSNDYLGFAKSRELYSLIREYEEKYAHLVFPGSGGSRLITGNHELYDIVETRLREIYKSERVLVFNSGYDANTGLFSSICGRTDTIFYDEYVHASIRDGIRLSNARSYSFRHNNLADLEKKLSHARGNVVIAVESVYSMDGIQKTQSGKYVLEDIIEFCNSRSLNIVVDEAHSTGIYGNKGEGIVSGSNLQDKTLARIHTFGKALGVHGAAIAGSGDLIDYLVNFSRSFIYTTALPPHSLISILAAHDYLASQQPSDLAVTRLRNNIRYFRQKFYTHDETNDSAIHSILSPGNDNAKNLAETCKAAGFDVRPILSPTVPKGKERLRICLHAFNTQNQMDELRAVLSANSGVYFGK